MDETAREQILRLRDHPRVIGYYSDNELGWWNAELWKMTLEHPSSSGQRRRLLRLLREVYANDWQRLLADFEPEEAEDWTGLERRGMLYMRSGGQGIHTMRRFLGILAERYYELMREIIQRHDPGALYLGDRYQSFYYPEVARASRGYVDDFTATRALQHWDGERGFVQPSSGTPIGDLYVCWNGRALYFGLDAVDITQKMGVVESK